MTDHRQALETLKRIYASYEMDGSEIDRLENDMADARVCVPIIGKFSSGKSALANTLLGKRLLKEDITPETAVPTELTWTGGTDCVRILLNDGSVRETGLQDYRRMELNAGTVRSVRIWLNNAFLGKIPSVMLVDMPGFESGYEAHNKAIDYYLPNSLAYIVTFPADDLIVRESVGNILRELCMNDMPVCVVVTKYDKRNDEFDLSVRKLRESLRKYVGDRELPILNTSSFDRDAAALEDYLLRLQEQSGELLERRFRREAGKILDTAENYLKTCRESSALTESQLSEEEDRLREQLAALEKSMQGERSEMERQLSGCVGLIRTDVEAALEAEEDRLVTMALNKSNMNEQVNAIVRRSVTAGVKRHLMPVIERYLNRVSATLGRLQMGEIQIDAHFDVEEVNKEISAALVGVVAMVLKVLPTPILNLILAAVATIVTQLLNERKREEAKEKIRSQLEDEVFPGILSQVSERLEEEIDRQVDQLQDSLDRQIAQQREAIEKALADTRRRIDQEKAEKEAYARRIEEDLRELAAIWNS